jgi:hypothetical protein
MWPVRYIITYRVRYGTAQGDLRYEHCILRTATAHQALDIVREKLCAKRGLIFVFGRANLYSERAVQRIRNNGYELEEVE